MIDIYLTYDATTRKLAATSTHQRNDVPGGTIGDSYTTSIHITFSGSYGSYTPTLAVEANVRDDTGHTIFHPEFGLDTNNTVTLPGYVMSAAINGRIPVQLHFTGVDDTTEQYYSENQINLLVAPAITDLKEVYDDRPESAINYAKVIRAAYIDTDDDNTVYSWTYALGVMPSDIVVLEEDESSTTSEKKYQEIFVNKVFSTNKVTLRFTKPPGEKRFWLKVLV